MSAILINYCTWSILLAVYRLSFSLDFDFDKHFIVKLLKFFSLSLTVLLLKWIPTCDNVLLRCDKVKIG